MDWSAAHLGFVIAAYLLSFAVLGGLIGFVVRRDRRLARDVELLEKQGAPDGR
jgi:heme exporter protein CcmD